MLRIFEPILNDYIAKKNNENSKNRYVGKEEYFSASSADWCHRRQYYKFNQYPQNSYEKKIKIRYDLA